MQKKNVRLKKRKKKKNVLRKKSVWQRKLNVQKPPALKKKQKSLDRKNFDRPKKKRIKRCQKRKKQDLLRTR